MLQTNDGNAIFAYSLMWYEQRSAKIALHF